MSAQLKDRRVEIHEFSPQIRGRIAKMPIKLHISSENPNRILIEMDPFSTSNGTYDLNHREFGIKIYEVWENGDSVLRHQTPRFTIDRKCVFSTPSVGAADEFSDDLELLQAMTRSEIQVCAIVPSVAVYTFSPGNGYIPTYGAAIVVELPDHSTSPPPRRSPSPDLPRVRVIAPAAPREYRRSRPTRNRQGLLSRANNMATLAMRARSPPTFRAKKRTAINLAEDRVNDLKRSLQEAEDSLTRFKKMRFGDNVVVKVRNDAAPRESRV